MPYKRVGKKVMSRSGGKWHVKQTCKSARKAEAAISLLRGKEHGWEPTGKKKKGGK